jgi:L-rhamnose-H+ transport protein
VPNLFTVYGNAGAQPLALLIVFGAGYGIAAACFGLGVDALGIALNFAIALGISIAIGSLLPLLTQHREQALTARGLTIIAGIAVTLLGIIVCAAAGKARERALTTAQASAQSAGFGKGLLFAIIAGIGSPFLNFGLAYGDPVLKSAAAQGASLAAQSNAIWPPVLTATLVPYLIYCATLWRRNRSFGLFGASGTGFYWVLGGLMGLLWMGSIALYGPAAASMAGMGPVIGWPLFNASIIITSNIWGFGTGEWRGAPQRAVRTMIGGMVLLIVGIGILAYSSSQAA